MSKEYNPLRRSLGEIHMDFLPMSVEAYLKSKKGFESIEYWLSRAAMLERLIRDGETTIGRPGYSGGNIETH